MLFLERSNWRKYKHNFLSLDWQKNVWHCDRTAFGTIRSCALLFLSHVYDHINNFFLLWFLLAISRVQTLPYLLSKVMCPAYLAGFQNLELDNNCTLVWWSKCKALTKFTGVILSSLPTLQTKCAIYSNTLISGTVSVPWKAFLLDEMVLIGMAFYGKWVSVPRKCSP